VADDLNELMPLIATTDSGEAASLDDAVAGAAALSFQRGGVRIQVMRRLKRGLIPVDEELDLHGLTQTAARDALADFIVRGRDSGHRCVRVIHGKGYRSGARGPVLKTAVNLWLRRHTDVIAFASARAIDGGTGAVYVLLRG
jgi:DNA-nicking Smr family endonuclease